MWIGGEKGQERQKVPGHKWRERQEGRDWWRARTPPRQWGFIARRKECITQFFLTRWLAVCDSLTNGGSCLWGLDKWEETSVTPLCEAGRDFIKWFHPYLSLTHNVIFFVVLLSFICSTLIFPLQPLPPLSLTPLSSHSSSSFFCLPSTFLFFFSSFIFFSHPSLLVCPWMRREGREQSGPGWCLGG